MFALEYVLGNVAMGCAVMSAAGYGVEPYVRELSFIMFWYWTMHRGYELAMSVLTTPFLGYCDLALV